QPPTMLLVSFIMRRPHSTTLFPYTTLFRSPESLTIPGLPERCTLQISTRIFPQLNTKLEGLYKSNGIFCTQCEAEGFRRITYYLDRPDVMARFRTRLVADRERYPVLLSNGNPVARGTLGDGRHFV